MEFKTFTSFSTLYNAFETSFYEAVSKKNANIALSGGSLKTLYKTFSKEYPKQLSSQIFWQVDERFIPRSDPNSNYKLIRDSFKKPRINLNYFDTEVIDWMSVDFDVKRAIKLALHDYEDSLKNQKPVFDLCILGIGMDGHIGSLFPNSNALGEKRKLVAHTHTEIFDVQDRLTLTFPQILKSLKILVVLQGKEKLEIYKKLKANKLNFFDFPANKLHEHSDVTVFFGNY